MTQEYKWYRGSTTLRWLKLSERGIPAGLVQRAGHNDQRWYVATWMPKEKGIAHLPAELTVDEAMEAAKMLILLSLKQTGSGEGQ